MKLKKFDAINVVPFIDVMLVLLTIVLTLATFVANGMIPLSLPKSAHSNALVPKKVEVSIQADGSLYFGKEPITKEGLKVRFHTCNPEDTLIIRSDKTVPMQFFVEVMDSAKEAGLSKIAVATVK